MLTNFSSHLTWKLSWTPSHKWSPLFQWTWTRLNFPLQKGCTVGHETNLNCNRCICPGCYTSIILMNNLVNRNRSFSVHAGKCRLFNRYLKLIKVDHKISCDYRFLSKFVLEFDFYPQRIWGTRLRKKNKACFVILWVRFPFYLIHFNAKCSNFLLQKYEQSRNMYA